MKFSSLILICSFLVVSNYCKSQNPTEAYLLPEDYRGKVVIVYRPFGDTVTISKDTVYYSIPPDGILIVKSLIKTKLKNSLFYQIDSTGNKQELNILSYDIIMSSPDSTNLKNNKRIFIFGTFGCSDNVEPESFCYSDFYVGSLAEMPHYYTPQKSEDFMSRLTLKARWKR